MDILSVKNILFQWFLNHDRLILPEDFLGVGKLFVVSDFPEFDLEVVKAGLKSYEENGLIKSFEFKDEKKVKNGYVLVQPLQNFSQSINISGDLAYFISNTINQTKDENDSNKSNCLGLGSADVEELLIIINGLLKEREVFLQENKQQ